MRGVRLTRARWRPPLALFVAGAVGLLIALPTLGMAAVVVLSRSPGELLDSLTNNLGKIVLVESIVLAGAVLVGYVFWRGLSDPLGRLVDRAEMVAAGRQEFDPSGPFGTREVARLAESFAQTVQELQRRSRYIETFSAHLAHEFRSPLTSIRGAAELMGEEMEAMTHEQRRRFLGNITGDVDRMVSLVSRLRDLARADTERGVGTTSIAELLDAMRGNYPEIEIVDTAAPGSTVPLSSESASIAFHHLFRNALDHDATRVHVGMTRAGEVTIENDGNPISEGDRHRVFQPFFTTRRETGGTGLGLAIASALVSQVGGTLALESVEPVRFAIRFGRTRLPLAP